MKALTIVLAFLAPLVLGSDRLAGEGAGGAEPAADIVLANFDGLDYGNWKVTGEAFGTGPMQGNEGFWPYQGTGLAYSMVKGDQSVGTLVSPEFRIERRYITFLIGGGNHPGETCINLAVDGKTVRTATGHDHEWLRRCLWDVGEFKGKSARIEIVDNHRGNWGHINVDCIVQTDQERISPLTIYEGKDAAFSRLPPYTGKDSAGWTVSGELFGPQVGRVVSAPFKIDRRYLNFYCLPSGEMTALCLQVGDQPVCASAYGPTGEDGWRCWDVGAFVGQTARFEVIDRHSVNIPRIRSLLVFLSDGKLPCSPAIEQFKAPRQILAAMPDQPHRYQSGSEAVVTEDLSSDYSEQYRPQFHFTVNHGWMNDPNGLLYYDGEYHLFMQHEGWGHAVSKDLLHWVQLPHALPADNLGACWSGSAVVDWNNSSGFQTGREKVLVALFTSYKVIQVNPTENYSRQIQSVAYSNDRGRTWTRYEGSPVIDEQDRDPRMFWHEPTHSWRMVMCQGPPGRAYWSSKDLKHWTKEGVGELGCECPDMFELPILGEPGQTKWIAVAGDGAYWVGDYDGKVFTRQTDRLLVEYGPNFYATQTFNDIPKSDGRRIQITWMNGGGPNPGTPCQGQQMTFPRELTLRRCPEGLRMFSNPVREIEKLHVKEHSWKDLSLAPGSNPLEGVTGDLFDIRMEIDLGAAAEVGLKVRGETIGYCVKDKKLTCGKGVAQVPPQNNRLKLQVLVDRVSLETFAQDGLATLSVKFMPNDQPKPLELFALGGAAKIVSLQVYELASAWQGCPRNTDRTRAQGGFIKLGPFSPPLADLAKVTGDLPTDKIGTLPWVLADDSRMDWRKDDPQDGLCELDQVAVPLVDKVPQYFLLQSDLVSGAEQTVELQTDAGGVVAAAMDGRSVAGNGEIHLRRGANRLCLIHRAGTTASVVLLKPGTTQRASDVQFAPPPIWAPDTAPYAVPTAMTVTRKTLAGLWRAKLTHKLPPAPSILEPHGDGGITDQARALLGTDVDDHLWQQVPVPSPWEQYTGDWGDADGEAVFRKTVSVLPQWAGKDLLLSLGSIDDFDDTFFNGVLVGRTDQSVFRFFAVQRLYRVPGKLVRRGANVIAVRVFDHFGNGGFTGDAADIFLTPAK